MDNTQLFTGLAEAYTYGRPEYSLEFIEKLYDKYSFTTDSVIADIGSGTGKFSKQLLQKGSTVFGVEPNDSMRMAAEKEFCGNFNFISVKGDAVHTNLKDNSVDFITTAQAFHWFDIDKFKIECARILKPGGKILLIWNVRDMDSPVNRESYKVFEKYCPAFRGFSGGIRRDDERIERFFDGKYQRISYSNPLYYDKERFIKRSLSGSYSLKKGDVAFDKYCFALEEIFHKYEKDGILRMENNTEAYIG